MERQNNGQKRKPLGTLDGNARQTRSRTGQGVIKPTTSTSQNTRSSGCQNNEWKVTKAVPDQKPTTEAENDANTASNPSAHASEAVSTSAVPSSSTSNEANNSSLLGDDLSLLNHIVQSENPAPPSSHEARSSSHEARRRLENDVSAIEATDAAGQTLASTLVAQSKGGADAGGEFDIDADEREDELHVVEYQPEILAMLRVQERRSMVAHDYMKKQTDINCKMRVILTDWLVEVHLKFKLRQETLYLTFQIIDRFLAQNNVARQRLQLVGVTALMIAAKYEEIYPPEVRDYVYICDNAYTRPEILHMEELILAKLEFRLSLPTVWSWLNRYVKAAGKKSDPVFFQLVSLLVELAMVDLLDLKMLKHLPSLLVASSIHVALLVLKETPWTPLLQHHTLYAEADLAVCSRELKKLLLHIGSEAKYKAVHKKFAHIKYHEVATLPISHIVA